MWSPLKWNLPAWLQKYGKVDVNVSNAAVNPAVDGILETKEAVLDKLWGINVKAALLLLFIDKCTLFHACKSCACHVRYFVPEYVVCWAIEKLFSELLRKSLYGALSRLQLCLRISWSSGPDAEVYKKRHCFENLFQKIPK